MPDRGPTVCGVRCGVERWAVKTLSDADREQVNLRPVTTTIEYLVGLPTPSIRPPGSRASAVELTVYRVDARLMALYGESDHDYHLVLASPTNPTVTMVAEIPDPACAGVCSSGFGQVFAKVRQDLFERLNAPGGERRPLIRVVGVGFFDFVHGQRGMAPNGIELHPVLAIEFVTADSTQ